MRLKYGPAATVAQESITGKMLIEMGINNPDFFPTIMSLNMDNSPFMSLLDAKGLKSKGVSYSDKFIIDNGRYNTVSNYHVQYRIEFSDMRKEHFRTNVNGKTFIDDANPTQPGLGKNSFYVFLDSNQIGGNDVFVLADGKTYLWCDNARGGEYQPGGVYRYKVKVVGNTGSEYVDTTLLQDGYECQLVMTMHRQDFSEFGNEKYNGHGIGDAFLTLQRLKYSYSGTAAAMDKNRKVQGHWIIGKDGSQAFLPYAHDKMLRTAAQYLDFQLLQGKGTVNPDTKKCVLTDETNQEIVAGDGILYSGDGPIEYPQSKGWTPRFVESFWQDIAPYCKPDEYGNTEFAMLMPEKSFMNFSLAAAEMGVTADSNIEGVGDDKIINNTYKGVSLGGIRGIAIKYDRMGQRPGITLKDGRRTNDYECIVVPLGRTASGQRGIELLQLRPAVNGRVAGIDSGGNFSASSVDGTSEHLLLQNGIINMNQVFKIYLPYIGQTL